MGASPFPTDAPPAGRPHPAARGITNNNWGVAPPTPTRLPLRQAQRGNTASPASSEANTDPPTGRPNQTTDERKNNYYERRDETPRRSMLRLDNSLSSVTELSSKPDSTSGATNSQTTAPCAWP